MLGPLPSYPVHINWLIYVWPRNRGTQQLEPAGIWTGGISREIIIPGVGPRTYHGAGPVIDLSQMTFISGVQSIQPQTLELNGLTPEVEMIMRGYEPKQADIEVHRWWHDVRVKSGGTIERAIKGKIDDIKFKRAPIEEGRSASELICSVTVMTAARMGTRTLALKKSDATQKMVNAEDNGRRYSASKAKVVWMGEVRDPYRVSPFSISDRARRDHSR